MPLTLPVTLTLTLILTLTVTMTVTVEAKKGSWKRVVWVQHYCLSIVSHPAFDSW